MSAKLNTAQETVLRWISDGCPDGVMEGYAHRISAVALQSRELIRIRGRGKTWEATITDAGRAWLASNDGRAESSATDRHAPIAPVTGDRSRPRTDRPTGTRASAGHQRTKQLVAEIVAAGGILRVPDESSGTNYRQRAYAAQRFGKVPAGKHLTVERIGNEFEIRLVDGSAGTELGADAVPVPERVGRYHPVARRLRDCTDIHEVSRSALSRVLRIVHGLATEIERRGHGIECVTPRRGSYDRPEWTGSNDGQLIVTINGHAYKLRLHEKGVGARWTWERAKADYERHRLDPYYWDRDRPAAYDKDATGTLELTILGYRGGRQSHWGDRKRWRLEDRLPQALRELETRAEEDEQRRIEAERAREERQRQWEAAIKRAESRFIDDYRAKVLRQRVQAWHDADAINQYCEAVEAKHGVEAIAEDPDAARWLQFARAHAERAQALPRMPPDPSPRPEDLKPYLGGLSPYGPPR